MIFQSEAEIKHRHNKCNKRWVKEAIIEISTPWMQKLFSDIWMLLQVSTFKCIRLVESIHSFDFTTKLNSSPLFPTYHLACPDLERCARCVQRQIKKSFMSCYLRDPHRRVAQILATKRGLISLTITVCRAWCTSTFPLKYIYPAFSRFQISIAFLVQRCITVALVLGGTWSTLGIAFHYLIVEVI